MNLKRITGAITAMICAASIFVGGYGSLIADASTSSDTMQYGDYLYYKTVDEDEDGTYDCVTIGDCDESAVSVEIPAEIDGLPVTIIAWRAFSDCTSLESITIPDSVKYIGDYAFEGTPLLENQTEVKYVDTWVVDCVPNVTSAEIKDGTKVIGHDAFTQCYWLESITIPDSVTSIGDSAFSGCCSLTSITIPDSVTSIGAYAFKLCGSLTSITILNPECEIYGDESTISNVEGGFNGTIYGYENSTAQAYAEKYGYTFESLGATPEFLVSDVVSLQKYITNAGTLTEDKAAKYDLNGDSILNAFDVIAMKRMILDI